MLFMATTLVIAKAQIPQPDPDTTAKHFLIVASIGNLQEIAAGQLAADKAQNAEVRQFGQMMVKDHTAAQQKLLQVAKSAGITLPPEATTPVQPDPRLKNAGDKFDKMYVHAMAAAHNNTVQTFQNYAVTGKNLQAQSFAQQTLPSLKMHLEHVEMIEKKVDSAK